jgi:thioredoxin 1
MSELTITKANFEAEVLNAGTPVLLDFWAEWCGPCRMLGPVVAEIAKEYEGRLKVGKINVDEDGELAQQHQISSIPSLVVYQGGKVVKRQVGLASKDAVEAMFKDVL